METSGSDVKDASSFSPAQNLNVMPWPMATENVEDKDLLQITETMTLLHNRLSIIIECSRCDCAEVLSSHPRRRKIRTIELN